MPLPQSSRISPLIVEPIKNLSRSLIAWVQATTNPEHGRARKTAPKGLAIRQIRCWWPGVVTCPYSVPSELRQRKPQRKRQSQARSSRQRAFPYLLFPLHLQPSLLDDSHRRSYLGGCSSLFSQPITLSVLRGSGPSHSRHRNKRVPTTPGGSAGMRCAPQLGHVGRSGWPMR